jgi:CheY-like chemotaxis protein
MAAVIISHDVLEPVKNILKSRGSSVDIEIDCPPGLAVLSDRLRLKQIVLNLAINACQHAKHGFVRLRAENINDNVRLLVEDSGPGIPLEKRSRLFAKFQESLDLLEQGTGIGVSLSKHLAKLLGGDIYLDGTYNSGVANCPGTRFVVDLKKKPLEVDHDLYSEEFLNGGEHFDDDLEQCPSVYTKDDDTVVSSAAHFQDFAGDDNSQYQQELPDCLSALFVDDDVVLRKLFVRSLRRVAESWTVQEATSGEAALLLCDTCKFDIIFVDQYMMSSNGDKQLLGTETVREMRLKGVKARICGLSANDVERDFLENGADTFLKKPYPCEKAALRKTLIRVLFG